MFDTDVSKEWYACIYCSQGVAWLMLLFPGSGMVDATVSREWHG